jgi:hypothetical protein
METFYSIIQYYPDPLNEERINIGFIVYSEEFLVSRFLEKWDRVKCFGQEDISFLQEFAKRVQESNSYTAMGLPVIPERFGPKVILEISKSWKNSIQITEPRLSLETPSDLIDSLNEQYLVKPKERKRSPKYQRREDIVRVAEREIKDALIHRVGPEPTVRLFRPNYSIWGDADIHHFDVGVANGTPYYVAHALSFMGRDITHMERQYEATAFAVLDVRRRYESLPIGVVIAPPSENIDAYGRALKALPKLGATVIQPSEMKDWSSNMAATRIDVDDLLIFKVGSQTVF